MDSWATLLSAHAAEWLKSRRMVQASQGKHWDMRSREWVDNPGSAMLIDDEVSGRKV